MTSLPRTASGETSHKKLGLVIDLDTCVGCHACAVSCKEWNTGGYHGPLSDDNAYGADPLGVWLNRIHHFETTGTETAAESNGCDSGTGVDGGRTVYFPRSCLHCEEPACVTVCPTGASYKREADGIVLVDEDKCIGCKLCSWACPYGAREYDHLEGVMKKCTLCVDRIYNETLDEEDRIPACVRACPVGARHFGDLGDPDSDVSKLVAERDGQELMPELGYKPVNRYLPPRERQPLSGATAPQPLALKEETAGGFLGWLDRMLAD
ncbi:MAG: 4Fe-4S dicluster domain-containing protein [Alphaproteobacteria bacterium]|nr:4Fe-4S dicluster domain-containing protein [Alphaproteobacteria bacterium]